MKKLALTQLMVLLLLAAWGQPRTIIKTFNNQYQFIDVPTCIKPLDDGGFAVAGYIEDSANQFITDNFLMKLDSNCNLLWAKVYVSGKNYDAIQQMDVTSDNGFLLIGDYTAPLADTTYGYSIIKTDSMGNFEWEKVYPGFEAYNFCRTSDKGYVLCGNINGPGYTVIGLTKVDSLFNLQWCYSYGADKGEVASVVRETLDHGFIVSGFTLSFGVDANALFLLRTDSNGHQLWTEIYDGPGPDAGSDIYIDDDSSFTICGTGGGGLQTIIKTDKGGNLIWAHGFFQCCVVEKILGAPAKGYYLLGTDENSSIYLVRTDSLGEFIWAKDFGINASYVSNCSFGQMPSGEFIISSGIGMNGYNALIIKTNDQPDSCSTWLSSYPTVTYAPSNNDVLFNVSPHTGQGTVINRSAPLAYTDSMFCTHEEINVVNNIKSKTVNIEVYPNPASSTVSVNLPSLFTGDSIYIIVTDMLGKMVIKERRERENDIKLATKQLLPGIYILKVADNMNSGIAKFVKE